MPLSLFRDCNFSRLNAGGDGFKDFRVAIEPGALYEQVQDCRAAGPDRGEA